MAIKVTIPIPLRSLTQGKTEVEIGGNTVSELIDNLEKSYPGIKERLCENGRIRRFINFYVNEEDIRFLDGANTALKEGDSISIIPAIAGGERKQV